MIAVLRSWLPFLVWLLLALGALVSPLAVRPHDMGQGHEAFASGPEGPRGVRVAPSAHIYAAEPVTGKLMRIDAQGQKTILLEGLDSPRDPALDSHGSLHVAETGAGRAQELAGAQLRAMR